MDEGQELAEFRALSPGLVTPDEVPNAQNLSLWLDVNGERMQTGSTKSMIFCVADLVSRFMRLERVTRSRRARRPGVGLGMKPPRFPTEADVVEASIERLGRQRQNLCELRTIIEVKQLQRKLPLDHR
jgi:hypothetical protein